MVKLCICCGFFLLRALALEYDVSDNRTVIEFTSKWGPPWEEADLVRMSAAFPAMTITFRFAEQGMGFVGSYTMQYGNCVYSLFEGDYTTIKIVKETSTVIESHMGQ